MADNVNHGLGKVNVLINGGLDGNQACYLAYTGTGIVYLVTDNGTGLLELGPNPWDSVSNGQCTIFRGTPNDGTYAETSGSTRIVNLKVQFNSNWTGAKTIYGALFGAGAFENENSGWQAIGTWMGSPSGGTVITTGIQFGGGSTQELLVRYLTPFPDDLVNGQVLLSSQPDYYLNSCQISWWPNRSLSVQGVAGTFDQGAGHPQYCAVAPGATLTRTSEGFDLRLKVTLNQQLLETFPNRDFYIATGAYTKNPFGGQPLRAVSRTPVDGDPDVSDELFIYNDRRWYFFTGYCFGCNVIGLGAGAGVNIRCTDPQVGAVPPTSLEPQSSPCGTPILYAGEVQRLVVAMSAPETTPAGPSAVFINASVAGAPQWSMSFQIPFQIRAAASARFPIRMSFFIPPVWIPAMAGQRGIRLPRRCGSLTRLTGRASIPSGTYSTSRGCCKRMPMRALTHLDTAKFEQVGEQPTR